MMPNRIYWHRTFTRKFRQILFFNQFFSIWTEKIIYLQ